MFRAVWNDTVIAEANDEEIFTLEGNRYFPENSLKMEFFKKSTNTYTCPWKGLAEYYTVVINDDKNVDAAWVYRDPTEEAKGIKDMFGFWNGVIIEHLD